MSGAWRPWAVTAALLAVATPVAAQRPILEVRLGGLAQVVVEGRLTADGVLELPREPLEDLTGEDLGEARFLSLQVLSRALGPQVSIDYQPRQALLIIRDPSYSLAANRRRMDRLAAESRAAPDVIFGRGPFGSVTLDARGERSVEAGWQQGRIAVHLMESTLSGTRWGVAAQPLSSTWVAYEHGGPGGGSLSARWVSGRTFARAAYATEQTRLVAQFGTSVGPVSTFVQGLDREWGAAVTIRGPMDLTVAHLDDIFTARVSYGRVLSPFILPRVR